MNPLLSTLIHNALFVTVFAVILTGLNPWIRQPWLKRSLWLVLLLKLVTPPIYSLNDLVPSLSPRQETIEASSENSAADQVVIFGPVSDLGENQVIPAESSIATPQSKTPKWTSFLLGAWALGALGLIALYLLRYRRVQKWIQRAELADPELQRETRRAQSSMGVSRSFETRRIHARLSPFLWTSVPGPGKRDPKIVFPHALDTELTRKQTELVLAHEVAHFRQWDHWVRRLEFLTLLIYWWLPTFWWIRRQLHSLEELCCDSAVAARYPGQAKNYARALLQVTDFVSKPACRPLGMAMLGEELSLNRRLKVLLTNSTHRLSWRGRAAAIAFGLAVLPCALIEAKTDDEESTQQDLSFFEFDSWPQEESQVTWGYYFDDEDEDVIMLDPDFKGYSLYFDEDLAEEPESLFWEKWDEDEDEDEDPSSSLYSIWVAPDEEEWHFDEDSQAPPTKGRYFRFNSSDKDDPSSESTGKTQVQILGPDGELYQVEFPDGHSVVKILRDENGQFRITTPEANWAKSKSKSKSKSKPPAKADVKRRSMYRFLAPGQSEPQSIYDFYTVFPGDLEPGEHRFLWSEGDEYGSKAWPNPPAATDSGQRHYRYLIPRGNDKSGQEGSAKRERFLFRPGQDMKDSAPSPRFRYRYSAPNDQGLDKAREAIEKLDLSPDVKKKIMDAIRGANGESYRIQSAPTQKPRSKKVKRAIA